MELIVNLSDQLVNVFADIDTKIISLTMLKIEKFIADIKEVKKNVTVKCSCTFQFLDRKT